MESVALATGVIALVAVIMLAVAPLMRRSRRARERLTMQGLDADAEVLKVWQDGMGSYCVRYRYTPRGRAQPITRDEIAGCLRAMLPDVGDTVSVRYDPENPEHARLQRDGC